MSLGHVQHGADTFRSYNGVNFLWLSGPLMEKIDEDFLVRAWKWYEDSINRHGEFGVGSTVLLEFMGPLLKLEDEVVGKNKTGEYHAGFLHPWNDLSEVFGENPEKLMGMKLNYGPKNRFSEGANFAGAREDGESAIKPTA
ncbi:hypothetical protein MBLNU230_g4110t1 [Neophaeotheca triangularis]